MLILFNGQKQWREVNPGKGTACSQSGASQPAQPLHPQNKAKRAGESGWNKGLRVKRQQSCNDSFANGWRGGKEEGKKKIKEKNSELAPQESAACECLALNGEWM